MNAKKIKIIISLSTIITLLAGAYFYYLFTYNFHTVVPKQIYRSAQLNKNGFENAIKQYDIKTVINLRGANPEFEWYQQEMAAINSTHVLHYDLPLEGKILPDVKTLKQLVYLIDAAPRPMLVHCLNGSDRTGLASAIALILQDNRSMSDIEEQVSFKYFALSSRSVGKQMLTLYKAWLQKNGLTTSRENFLLWLNQLQEGVNYPSHQNLVHFQFVMIDPTLEFSPN